MNHKQRIKKYKPRAKKLVNVIKAWSEDSAIDYLAGELSLAFQDGVVYQLKKELEELKPKTRKE